MVSHTCVRQVRLYHWSWTDFLHCVSSSQVCVSLTVTVAVRGCGAIQQLKGRSSPVAERLDNDTSHQHSVPMCPDLLHFVALPCRSAAQPCHCLRTVESLRDVAAAANTEDNKASLKAPLSAHYFARPSQSYTYRGTDQHRGVTKVNNRLSGTGHTAY